MKEAFFNHKTREKKQETGISSGRVGKNDKKLKFNHGLVTYKKFGRVRIFRLNEENPAARIQGTRRVLGTN